MSTRQITYSVKTTNFLWVFSSSWNCSPTHLATSLLGIRAKLCHLHLVIPRSSSLRCGPAYIIKAISVGDIFTNLSSWEATRMIFHLVCTRIFTVIHNSVFIAAWCLFHFARLTAIVISVHLRQITGLLSMDFCLKKNRLHFIFSLPLP